MLVTPTSGVLSLKRGIVPHCFTLHFVEEIPGSVRIVFDCSSQTFYEITPQNCQIPEKTIETIHEQPAWEKPKKHGILTCHPTLSGTLHFATKIGQTATETA
jgi:hypothetical protein